MSPLQLAIDKVGRAVASFHPRTLPLLLRAHYGRELSAWCLLPLMLGALEGGVVAVIAKTVFSASVHTRWLNLAVAILVGAPAFANVVSFLWVAASHGRPKIRFLVALQVAVAVCVALIAVAPAAPIGLFGFTAGVVVARMCWSGVVALRSTVWRANYPRRVRASLAGKLATVQALAMTLAAAGIGLAMTADAGAFRLLFPLAAAVGLAGAWVYSGLGVRGHRALLRAERSEVGMRGSPINPLKLRWVLSEDSLFRRYMTCTFIFGAGNLMVTGPLVIMLNDRFEMPPLTAILIVSAIPTLLMPLSIPLWSRLLDRVHVVRFRSVHSWSFVLSTGLLLWGVLAVEPTLLWLGAIVKGVAYGGGVLGWNLGHHDFAPAQRASQYMGVHMMLTGIRGLLAPVIGVSLYEILEALNAGSGAWTLALCLALTLIGALGFVAMRDAAHGRGGEARFADGPPIQPPAAG